MHSNPLNLTLAERVKFRLHEFEMSHFPDDSPTRQVGYKFSEALINRIDVYADFLGITNSSLVRDCLWSCFPEIEKLLDEHGLIIDGLTASQTIARKDININGVHVSQGDFDELVENAEASL